jgi:hypothetical protein
MVASLLQIALLCSPESLSKLQETNIKSGETSTILASSKKHYIQYADAEHMIRKQEMTHIKIGRRGEHMNTGIAEENNLKKQS